ncbi:hypothetical protein Rxycam_01468 [Rubrobacter xylanophilus DSM 9941]|nr:hypothetical protein Rxycam_01468 [Rubrobacter xylanophilus DSM 9941]
MLNGTLFGGIPVRSPGEALKHAVVYGMRIR